MKNSLIGLSLLGVVLSGCNEQEFMSAEAFDGNEKARKEYYNYIHRAAPEVDWKAVNANNLAEISKQINRNRSLKSSDVSLFDGAIVGAWHERGSDNQAGDVREVALDSETDSIYAMSTAGMIWKGHINGTGWRPLDDTQVHLRDILTLVKTDAGNRLIVAGIGDNDKQLYYSDDEGKTFTPTQGLSFYDTYGAADQIVQLNDDDNTLYYLAFTWIQSPWGAGYVLYKSVDGGASFTLEEEFTNSQAGSISMAHAPGDNDAFIIDAGSRETYRINASGIATEGNSNLNLGTDIQLTVTNAGATGNIPVMFALRNEQDVLKSTDGGSTWSVQGTTPKSPYRAGLFADPLTEDQLYFGEVEMYTSFDGGAGFVKYSNWYDFYYDSEDKPHADLMRFTAQEKANGDLAYFVLNHSGIHMGTNTASTLKYINPLGLNICTYYDFVSEDEENGYLYVGAQDKGYHLTTDDGDNGVESFEFAVTGDYFQMHITEDANNNNRSVWREYPYGRIWYHRNPTQPNDGGYYETLGSDKQIWIVPSSPSPYENAIWLGGGNNNGGSGSYLIKLTADLPDDIAVQQIDYNFKSNSGGANISATNQSAANADRLYVSCANGRFFYSNNGGDSWTRSNAFAGPEGRFLYGTFIHSSAIDEDLLWIAGSGYSNPGVYVSTDGGESFTGMATGLPETFVWELATDPEEKFLFAATDAGPYVCDLATGIWENMLGNAPVQSYRAVQYMPNLNRVRFATYGRGIWDFAMETNVGVEELVQEPATNLYPNPVVSGQPISVTAKEEGTFVLYSTSGKVILEENIAAGTQQLKAPSQSGAYLWRFLGKTRSTGTVIVQ